MSHSGKVLSECRMWPFFFFILYIGSVHGVERIDPLVQTDQGLIRGLKADDGDYSIFLGIPYAEVDMKNPFGISKPYPQFDQVYHAYDDSAICPQVEDGTDNIIGHLDCLRLNIYVPNEASSSNKLAVLVWLHGGNYNVGYSSRYHYGGQHLVKRNIIVVTVNYRLGAYGFLCLGTPEVPGNQGIKDQVLALRWVKANIEAFGGDVNKITLMGESAGSSSAEMHLLSKQEKLFDKVILQSGTLLKPRGVLETDPTPALQIAETLGFPTDNVSEAMLFLSQVDPTLVIGASSQLSLRVCVEKEFDNVANILTEHPLNIDVPKIRGMPILAGYTNREALMTDANKPNDYFKTSTYFRETLKLLFDVDDDFQEMEDIVRHYYLGDEEPTEEVRDRIVDLESDFYYNYPIQWSLSKFLENGALNIFQYMFSYVGDRNFMKMSLNITLDGAAHTDELGYFFVMSASEGTPSCNDQLIIDRMTTLWTNFVKYGNPTPERTQLVPVDWLPITSDTHNYLDINSEVVMKKRPFNDRLAFWELFFKANQNRLKGYSTLFN